MKEPHIKFYDTKCLISMYETRIMMHQRNIQQQYLFIIIKNTSMLVCFRDKKLLINLEFDDPKHYVSVICFVWKRHLIHIKNKLQLLQAYGWIYTFLIAIMLMINFEGYFMLMIRCNQCERTKKCEFQIHLK